MIVTVVPRDTYRLVDGVLDEGLPFVASYLENKISRSIIITDNNGKIHYPNTRSVFQIEDAFVQISIPIVKKEYYYQEQNCSLYYRIEYKGSYAFVVVNDIPQELLCQAISILRGARLAVKCYFTKINKNKKEFEKKLVEYLFLKSTDSINDVIRLSERELEPGRHYLVLLMEVERNREIDWQLLCSYACEYFKRKSIDVISVYWKNYLLVIVPALKTDILEKDLESLNLEDVKKFKEVIENKFSIITSLGIGQTYPLEKLYQSFEEARVALTLPRLMKKKEFIQYFSELGIYSFVFSQSLKKIKNYCLKTLGPLIEQDNDTDCSLLPTIRTLLDSGFSMKSTADSLHIHVNTLYYRINKIEQLLDLDLSKMSAQVELYTAIKVWDTLKINGFIYADETGHRIKLESTRKISILHKTSRGNQMETTGW
ncbi:MAG: helix-turn-helix domain-containing protein [Syntrophaceticus sp.]